MATSDPICVTALDIDPGQSTINATVGALVVGGWLQALLFGVLLVHTGLYYSRLDYMIGDFYRLDCGHLVCALLILNSLEVAMDFHVVYRTAVTHSGDYCTFFDHQTWTMWLQPAINGIIGFLAQAFFLMRCWRATNKSRVVTSVLLFFIILSLGSGLAVTITAFQRKSLIAQLTRTSVPMALWLISTAVTNLAIASLLVTDILKAKPSSFKRPAAEGGVLRRIAQLTLETGGMTAVIAVLNLVLYFAEKGTAYHLILQYSLSRIYTISVLVALLARRVPDRDAAAPYGSFSLSGSMQDRTVSKLEINKVVESDHPDGSVTGTDPGSTVDTKTLWSPNAV